MKLDPNARRWQTVVLNTLLLEAGKHDVGPWVPTEVVLERGRIVGCTPQAVSGALRALRNIGLADFSQTFEGGFWKASDAAERARLLLEPESVEAA